MTSLRATLDLPYDQLEDLNLEAKQARIDRTCPERIREERIRYLHDEKRINAVTVCFSDLEGRLHMVDYDKRYLLKNHDDLNFDSSSVSGFAGNKELDLRLDLDWHAFYWLPADLFGPGKVLIFANTVTREDQPYPSDFRGRLKAWSDTLWEEEQIVCNIAPEIEGFLFKGRDAECRYHETGRFEYVSVSGYFRSLPGDTLRTFIDDAAEVRRALGFQNEKGHPEVAPSQFEMNFSYADALISADQVQLYKLLCRQVAAKMGCTASFLPKPITGVHGSGMHTNISFTKGGQNLFWDPEGLDQLSAKGWGAARALLSHADDLCLILNPSVNAYRRLDPTYDAANEIKVSSSDRGAMIRVPPATPRSARIEIRSIAPDANPYLLFFALAKVAFSGERPMPLETALAGGPRLSDNIYDALRDFRQSPTMTALLDETVQEKYADVKERAADRCPRALGTIIKPPEIQFHHEVTNQYLWSLF